MKGGLARDKPGLDRIRASGRLGCLTCIVVGADFEAPTCASLGSFGIGIHWGVPHNVPHKMKILGRIR